MREKWICLNGIYLIENMFINDNGVNAFITKKYICMYRVHKNEFLCYLQGGEEVKTMKNN